MKRPFRIAGLVALFGLVFAAAWVPIPYFAVGPGPANDIDPLIDIKGVPRYPSEGRLIMTTVRWEQLTALGSFIAWVDDSRFIVGEDAIYPPGVDRDQEQDRAISQMDQSKIDASIVVLTELFDYPKDHGTGALIEATGPDCPADGELFVGDTVVAIDGRRVETIGEARRAIDGVPPGEPVAFRVRAGGEVHEIELTREPCAGSEEPLVGIQMVSAFPFGIEIASGDVGGPSGGLMFSLGLYDALTPGDLTGGRTIAGTGTISPSGKVGGIGGIVDKVIGAERAGATVFLVPAENMAELRDVETDLRLISVSSFTQAVDALEAS
ncbi:MAG: PDZ domain-containing protein [Actinomycetota bacterium]|nr:PDZ domain-containing protein [Actinomycetota bacterium]MDH5225602.1 PDZ domain-containing protein [Actinomycetota bacterium]MDH5313560.1 PDZ domain-containing protein [Actinomycetota bacterium]